MKSIQITPRFNDTDCLGHINHSTYSMWFEMARRPIFQVFTPDLDPKKWKLIVAKTEIEFLAQCYYQFDVELQTEVEKIGNSSFVVLQRALQNGKLVAEGRAYMVQFDYQNEKSILLSEEQKTSLKSI